MQNYKGDDEKVVRPAPVGGVTSGTPVVIGSEFLVPETTAAATADVSFIKRGRVTLPSESTDTFTAGLKVYWNPTSGKVEDTDSASNYEIGTAKGAAVSDVVEVCLNGVALASLTGDLVNKIDKVTGQTNKVASFTASGSLESSGIPKVGAATAGQVAISIGDGTAVWGTQDAGRVAVEDSGTLYTATDVEAALAEVKTLADAAIPRLKIEIKEITILLGAATGSSAADPDWVGAIPLGAYPKSGNDQPIASVSIAGDGAVTVTTAANETAEAVITVSALLAA